jgi:RNA polymerase sigma-54 factor
MQGMHLGIAQRQKQVQTLKMSPQMLQTISILALPATELREAIYREVEENPALEIVHDGVQEPDIVPVRKTAAQRVSDAASGSSAASDAFQAFIESRPMRADTLQNHLLRQLALMRVGKAERSLAEKIIGSLDNRGFFAVPPETLLNADNPEETPALLRKALAVVRRLDPAGIACADVYESLFLQAKALGNAPPLALFLLDGRLGILEGAKPQRILKKIDSLASDERAARGFNGGVPYALPEKITAQDIESALEYIRRLDPFPARAFDAEPTIYISPDVYVTRVIPDEENAPREARFRVTFARAKMPRLSLSPAFQELAAKKNKRKNPDAQFARPLIQDAKVFLDAVEQREQTIVKAAEAIVKAQIPFFEKGPRYLLPLKMKDIADSINVHEATVSRIANGKYIQCEWGLFEIRYFFSNQVSSESLSLKSKESVKQELIHILKEYESRQDKNPARKKLTDQELVSRLQARGITIARRTVAKYRAELNINSSFDR